MKLMLTQDHLIVDGTEDEVTAFIQMRDFFDYIAEDRTVPLALLGLDTVSSWTGLTWDEYALLREPK